MEYYSVIKKKKILSGATAWMKLEDIMVGRVRQTPKDKYHVVH